MRKSKKIKQKGFTLIELLVVISIIALLSTVVFASLSTARTKAQDTAIISDMNQMEILLQQEYLESGNYANLQNGGVFNNTADDGATLCAPVTSFFGGKFKEKMAEFCRHILSMNKSEGQYTLTIDNHWYTPDPSTGLMRWQQGDPAGVQKYSVQAWLPGRKTWWCVGTSGKGEAVDSFSLGCNANP